MNINKILEKIEGFTKLTDRDQLTVENNLHNLIGNVNIIIDSQLVNDDHFLEHFFKILLQLDSGSSISVSEKFKTKNEMFLTNYISKEADYEFLKYNNLIQPLKLTNKNFEQDVQIMKNIKSDTPSQQSTTKTTSELLSYQKLESDKTVVLLSDSGDPQGIFNDFIEPVFNENVFIVVFGRDGFPSFVTTKSNMNTLGLKYDFNKDDILDLFDYLNIHDNLSTIFKTISDDVNDKLNYNKNFDDLFSEFEKHINAIKEKKQHLMDLANIYKDEIQVKTIKNLDENIPVETIVKELEAKDVRKKKNDQKEFAEKFLELKVRAINILVEDRVNLFNNKTKHSIKSIEADFVQVSGLKFGNNIGSWFASGLAGVGSYGALALYMSSLGNLGGYILVAKGVSVLAGFGIATGGTAAAISTVSALGGPIGIAIGAGLATALISKSLLGIGWKKSLAKQIRKTAKNNVIPEINDMNEALWEETREAVAIGFDEIIKESRRDFMVRNKDIIKFEEIKKINEITNTFK